MSDILTEKIDHLPLEPGVYIYKGARGDADILYVGKARRLRNRVRSYFQDSRNHDGRLRVMVSKIVDLEVIVTDSEAEALILENNLIKKYQPRYNIMYRDDKSYPYICLTKPKGDSDTDRPRIFPTRTVIKDGSKYFGPYDSVVQMKRMLETIRAAFGLCTCACSPKMIDRSRYLPKWHNCFDDYFDNCSVNLAADIYQDNIDKVVKLLNGRTDGLIRELKEEMGIAAAALQFEKAAKLRDGISALDKYGQKMKMVVERPVDRDIFALETDQEEAVACGVLFKIREGKLIGKFHRYIRNIEGVPESEMLQSFVEDYYTGSAAGIIPGEVYLSTELDEPEPLMDYLYQEYGRKVPMAVPKQGEKAQMIRMARTNAKLLLNDLRIKKAKEQEGRIPHSVQALKRDLRLQRMPRRIECFDNSNFQGSDPVASMVTFVDGQPRKALYKRFNIKTVVGPDDFASMKEVLTRRYTRVMREKQHIPDLIVVDGGKGQLSSAVEALKEIDFYGQVSIIGLAKRLEEVFMPGDSEPIMIPKTSSSLKLLQRVRDEAHRFAITFHREKRKKRTLVTHLTDIDGIGDKTATRMLKHFGSVKRVKEASQEDLIAFLGAKTGEKVFQHFHGEEETQK